MPKFLSLIFVFVFGNLYAQSGQNPLIQSAFPPNNIPSIQSSGFTLDTSIATFDNSKWHPNWDEANVFKAELGNNDYALRIGQGGQLYSIETPIGEICPPQWQEHAWVDDTWLLTTYQYDLNVGGGNEFTAFIHQCGIYPHIDANFQQGNQFWAPIVAEDWDTLNHAYSTISLGMISSGPSYNRADMLMYQKTRDLGDGVFEVVYMAYNYNTSYTDAQALEDYQTDFSPWGGVRESKLPDHILSLPGQTWELDNHFGAAENHETNTTGGWAISTQDESDSTAYSLGYVFGASKPATTINKFYSHTTVGPARDFGVQALVYRQPFRPGKTMYCRLFYVLGDFESVKDKCIALQQQATGGFLNFTQSSATQIPMYLDQQNGQMVISETGTNPAFYVYAEPVKDSKPLYLIKNNQTDEFHATCDPYMTMPRYAIPSDTNFLGVRPYDGTTEIIKLFGYVMPIEACNSTIDYVPLNSILLDSTYYPEDGLYDVNIMVVNAIPDAVLNINEARFEVFPNPTSGLFTLSLNSGLDGEFTLGILDARGRVLEEEKHLMNGSRLIKKDLSLLGNGLYYVRVLTANSSHIEKVVLHK